MRRLWIPIVVPMIAVPLALRAPPTQFLPVLAGDYLAAHFLACGLISAPCLVALGARRPRGPWGPVLAAAGASVAFGVVAPVWPIGSHVTSFVPGPERIVLPGAMPVGTLAYFLAYFLADDWATRGLGAGRGGHVASKVAFLVSLAIAVSLDCQRLFFLIIIVPVIVLFFAVCGIIGAAATRATGHPFVGALASAVAFAWAIGATFPLLAGRPIHPLHGAPAMTATDPPTVIITGASSGAGLWAARAVACDHGGARHGM